MYYSGWGFHTKWRDLTKAAIIWRGIRQLRLIRIRHQKDLASGLASVNLASMPEEIIRIIEDMLVTALHPLILGQEPFNFDPQDCCSNALAEIIEWQPYWDALLAWGDEHNYDLSDDNDWDMAYSDFMDTSLATELRETYLDIHFDEGPCEKIERKDLFWLTLPRNDLVTDTHLDLKKLVSRTISLQLAIAYTGCKVQDIHSAIVTFLKDHGLEVIRYTEGQYNWPLFCYD